jgi:hypothetical protein
MDAKTFCLMAGVISGCSGALPFGADFYAVDCHHRGLVGAEVGELGSAHCRWWPRSSRVEGQRAKRVGQFRLATQ